MAATKQRALGGSDSYQQQGSTRGSHLKILQRLKLRLSERKNFLTELHQWASQSEAATDEEFCILIDLAVTHYGVPAQSIAAALDVAPSAISRWMSGASAPRRYARSTVISTVASLLQEQVNTFEAEIAAARRRLMQEQ